MRERKLSTRLIRKGALIEETYNAFREWEISKSMRDNLQTIREGNLIGAKSDGWLKEVLATISSRFSGDEEAEPLAILAQGGIDTGVWKCCLLWHIGTVDDLYFRFAADWLMERYREGAYALRSEHVVPDRKSTRLNSSHYS